jgi:IS30 family transposase
MGVLSMASSHRYSVSQRNELWKRWKQGESLADIGEALGKRASSIYIAVRRSGGVTPDVRHRSVRHLRAGEREEISRGIAVGSSIRQIAATLGRAPSTVSREVARNNGLECYRAEAADNRAWERARRPKRCRLATRAGLRRAVARKLRWDWAPQQIAQWLKRRYPDDAAMQVSHETIYQTLFVQARGVFKKELTGHLRRSGQIRRPRKRSVADNGILDAISIRERPAEAEDRAVPGHWEGDLLAGTNNSHIATLVERHSRFVMLVKIDSKESVGVATALARKIRKLPAELRRSLTWDRGTEMAAHKQFTVATDVKVYFCDPRSPWQRGSNENTNGLLRQYFPKGKDVSGFSQAQLNQIAIRLNERPRETLQWRSPAQVLRASVALTD